MADHPEAFGPAEPSPLPEGEFKSDFFGHARNTAESTAGPKTLSALPPAPPEPPSKHPIFPVIIGVGFLGAIVVAAIISARSTAPAPAPATAAATETPAEAPAKDDDVKARTESLKAEMANLAKEVKDLDGRVAALPKPSPAPDLTPLNDKVATLSKSVEALAPLSKKVDDLDKHLSDLAASLKSLQDGTSALKEQVASLRRDVQAPAPSDSDTSTRDAAKPVNANVEGQSFAQAAELFKAGRYKEASDVLKTTEQNDPKDARVWYYAALSKGLSTGVWDGDTQKLVMKGVQCEKAGTPATGEIDAEFSKLPAGQKNWLDAYRKLAQK